MKWVFRILVALVVVIVVAAAGGAIFISTIDKEFVENRVRDATGRDLAIGAMDLNLLSASPSVAMRDVTFANAPWGEAPHAARIDAFEAEVKLFPLLSGVVDVTRVVLVGADVHLETDADGRSNMDFEEPRPEDVRAEPSEPRRPPEIEAEGFTLPIVRLVDVQNVKVTMRDGQSGQVNVIDIAKVGVTGTGPDDPLDVVVDGQANDLPIALEGQLGAPAAMLDASIPWTARLGGDVAGMNVQLDGEIRDPMTGRGVDLVVAVAGDELADAARIAGIDVPTIGAFNVQAALTGDADGELAVGGIEVAIGKPDFVRIELTGDIASATTVEGVDLQLRVEGTETGNLSPVVRRFAGQPVPALGPYRLTATVLGGQAAGVAVRDIDFALGRADLLVVNANGSIGSALEQEGLSLGFAVEAPEIGALSDIAQQFAGQSLPDLGPLSVKGVVTGGMQTGITLSDIDLDMGRPQLVYARVTGSIGDVVGVRGISIQTRVTGEELGNLSALAEQYAGQSAPALGPVDIAATIVGDIDGVLRIEGLDASLGRTELIRVTAQGGIENALAQTGIGLNITATSNQIGALTPLARQFAADAPEIPALGRLEATARIAGDAGGPLALDDIDVALGGRDVVAVTVTGRVGDALNQKDIALDVAVTGDETGALNPLTREFGGAEVPYLGPYRASASVAGDVESDFRIDDLDVSVGTRETALMTVRGAVAAAMAARGVDVAVTLDSPDLSVLKGADGEALPAIGPLQVRARVQGGTDEAIRLDDFAAEIGGSDVSGSATADFRGEKPVLTAALTSNFLDTSDLNKPAGGAAAPQRGQPAAAPTPSQQPDDGRVIPNDPLPLEALKSVDAEVTYKATELRLEGTDMRNLDIAVRLKDGDLAISPFKADAVGGGLDGEMRLNGAREIPEFALRLNADQLDVGSVLMLAGQGELINGPLSIDVSVVGLGDNPRAIAGTLGGTVKLAVLDGVMNGPAIREKFGRGGEALSSVLLAGRDRVVLNCLVADYTVERGVATTQIGVLDNEVVTIIYDGDINLREERLALDVTPQAGIAVVNVGIPLRVGGTFASPSVNIRAERAILGAGLGILTGGVAPALGAILGQSIGADHPCANLDEKVQSQQPAQPTGQQAPTSPEDAVRGLIDRGVRGLFGN